MANQKITELTNDTTPTNDDLVVTVHDPGGTPVNRKVTLANLFFQLQQWLFAQDAGGTDDYAITLSPAPAALVTGQLYRFKANTANTGAATLNINGLGAKTIKKVAGGITTDLATNDIRSGQWVDVVYDGTNFQMQSTLGNTPSGGTTINASDNSLPYRSNATTFSDSYLAHDSGNGQTYSHTGNIAVSQNNGKIIGFANQGSAIAFGGFKAGQAGSCKVVSDSTGAAGTLYSDFAAFATPGGDLAPWSSVGMNFYHLLTASKTLRGPANNGGTGVNDGYRFLIMFVQDGTGGRTITWNSEYKFPGGSAPTVTAAANAVDIYEFIAYGTNAYLISKQQDVK